MSSPDRAAREAAWRQLQESSGCSCPFPLRDREPCARCRALALLREGERKDEALLREFVATLYVIKVGGRTWVADIRPSIEDAYELRQRARARLGEEGT